MAEDKKRFTYEVHNQGARGIGLPARGGVQVVKTNEKRVLELTAELDEDRIEQLASQGIIVSESQAKAENAYHPDKPERKVAPAEDPAETGGVVAQSEVSEKGGVKRKEGDTTTTTKPSEAQHGAKA